MPIETHCPECGRMVRVPDHLLGQSVQCPVCAQTFPAAGESKPDDAPVETFRESPAPADSPAPTNEEPIRRPIPHLDPNYDDDDDDFDNEDDDEDFIDAKEERFRGRRQRQRMERAKAKVTIPAIGLMVVGAVDIIGAVLALALIVFLAVVAPGAGGGPGPNPLWIQAGVIGVSGSFLAIFGLLILYGAIRMKQMRMYGMAMTACVFAAFTALGSCCVSFVGLIGLPLGLTFSIWGFIVLADADVKASFQ